MRGVMIARSLSLPCADHVASSLSLSLFVHRLPPPLLSCSAVLSCSLPLPLPLPFSPSPSPFLPSRIMSQRSCSLLFPSRFIIAAVQESRFLSSPLCRPPLLSSHSHAHLAAAPRRSHTRLLLCHAAVLTHSLTHTMTSHSPLRVSLSSRLAPALSRRAVGSA